MVSIFLSLTDHVFSVSFLIITSFVSALQLHELLPDLPYVIQIFLKH